MAFYSFMAGGKAKPQFSHTIEGLSETVICRRYITI
jgi:hypothetical protein